MEIENPEHNSNDKKCKCHECTRYRNAGCTHPNTCFNEAGHLLNDIAPKYNPQEDDHLLDNSATEEDYSAVERHAIGPPGEVKIFDPCVTSTGTIHENFRIFTNPKKRKLESARRDPRIQTPPDIIAFTDGSCYLKANHRKNGRFRFNERDIGVSLIM